MTDGPPPVDVESVSHVYPGGHVALREISLRVERGERLGVLGPNGGGKSTLVRLLCGLLEPTEGRVRIFGRRPAEAARRGLVGFVAQRPQIEPRLPISGRDAVLQPLACDLSPWARLPASVRDRADRAIETAGASAYAHRPFSTLSGGQRQRLLIARAVAPNPTLLVLDEPTTGIDAAGQRTFADLIARLGDVYGMAIVTVSHELRTVAATSDRVACLSRTLHFHDSPRGLTPGVLRELFQHDVEAVLGAGPEGQDEADPGAGGGGPA